MYYIIHFDIASLLILLVIINGRKAFFKDNDYIVSRFIFVITLTTFVAALNIVCALCYDCIIPNSDRTMLSIETLYFILGIYSCYAQLRVICLKVDYSSDSFRVINFIILAFITVCLLVNLGISFMFEYIDHTLIEHPFFLILYIGYIAFFAEMFFILFINRKKLRPKILVLTSTIVVFPVIAVLIQFLYDRLLLVEFGATMAFLVFGFTLNDKDYFELQAKLEELQLSKEAEMKSLEEVARANRVKTLFLNKISKELETPINEAINISDEILASADEEKARGYAGNIKKVGNELLLFVGELINVANEN